MLSIAKCQDLDYYERELVEGREDYLSEAGSSPGSWVGSLAAADGLVGRGDRDELAAAFAGFHPNGSPMTVRQTTVRGFDLTLSPSKSVSLVWALGTDEDARQVEAALYAARVEVERYLEANACLVRRAHAGAVTEPGAGFMGAVFLHRTSRLGDPGVHLHWVVFNATEGPDGRRTALDGRALYQHRYTGEAIFQATLRQELAVRLGLVFDEMDRHGVAEVAGINAEMRRAFSRRRAEIVAEMERVGGHSAAAARVAALTTRKAKPKGVTDAELRAEWRARAGDHRFDLSNVPRVPRTPTLAVTDDELAAALTVEDATFDRRDVIRAAANAARQGATLDAITERAERFLGSAQAIRVGEGRWTTPEMLYLERCVLAVAAGDAHEARRATPLAVEQAMAARPSLTAEQRDMVAELCGSGRPVDVVVGRAGTGKTFTLDAVREAFEASGHRVLGASLAARAARQLQSDAGIASTTAAALAVGLQSGRISLGDKDVLVIDEAGMVGTRLMAALVTEADRAHAKVILVGDPKQLPEIDAGGLFAALVDRTPVVELVENRRMRNPVDRLAANALRAGRAEFAVRCLDEEGRITIAHNADELRDRLVADWATHRAAGQQAVMGAVHRCDVDDLNLRAHQLLEAERRLGDVVAVVDDRRFCIGDQVLALQNRYDLGVLNGDVAVISGGDDRNVHVDCGDGRQLRLPLDYVADHVQYGYARTVHKTQGLTCDVALLLGDDTLYAELGYTGLTRGSRENRLYTVVTAQEFEGDRYPLEGLVAALATSRAKTPAIDYLDPPELS